MSSYISSATFSQTISQITSSYNRRPNTFPKHSISKNGEGGIRTHGKLIAFTDFRGLHLKPLGHLSLPSQYDRKIKFIKYFINFSKSHIQSFALCFVLPNNTKPPKQKKNLIMPAISRKLFLSVFILEFYKSDKICSTLITPTHNLSEESRSKEYLSEKLS